MKHPDAFSETRRGCGSPGASWGPVLQLPDYRGEGEMTSPGGPGSGQSRLQEAVLAFSDEVFQTAQRLLQAQHELVRMLLGSNVQAGSESGEAASGDADEQE